MTRRPSAHGPQHHPCGCVNASLICPCTATLPVATPAQWVVAVAQPARPLQP